MKFKLLAMCLLIPACASTPASTVVPETPVQEEPKGPVTWEGCAPGEHTHAGVRLDCGTFEIVESRGWKRGANVLRSVDAMLREIHGHSYQSAPSSFIVQRIKHPSLDYTLDVGTGAVTGRYVHAQGDKGEQRLLQCTSLESNFDRCEAALQELVLGGVPAHLAPARQTTHLLPRLLDTPLWVAPECQFEQPGRVRCDNAVLTWKELPGGRKSEAVFIKALREQLSAKFGKVDTREHTCTYQELELPCTELRAGNAHFWVTRVVRGERSAIVSCGHKSDELPALCRQAFMPN